MYAIQTGSKFLVVRYFIDPDKVFGTSISAKPKQWKTKEEAELHLKQARSYFAERIVHMKKIAQESCAKAAKAQARVVKLKEELELLIERPYKEVWEQVQRKLAELEKRERDAEVEGECAVDYSRTLKKFEKLAEAEFRVVAVRQMVDTLAV